MLLCIIIEGFIFIPSNVSLKREKKKSADTSRRKSKKKLKSNNLKQFPFEV